MDISAQDLQSRYKTSRIHLRYNTWSLFPTLYSLRRNKKTQKQTHEPFPPASTPKWQITALADFRKFFLIGLHSRHKRITQHTKTQHSTHYPFSCQMLCQFSWHIGFPCRGVYKMGKANWDHFRHWRHRLAPQCPHIRILKFTKCIRSHQEKGVELTPFQTCGPHRHQLETG